MNTDEIFDDEGMKDKIKSLLASGTIKAVPNLRNISGKEKEVIAKKVGHHCLERLMQAYVALGLAGHFNINAIDSVSGIEYRLQFKVILPKGMETED